MKLKRRGFIGTIIAAACGVIGCGQYRPKRMAGEPLKVRPYHWEYTHPTDGHHWAGTLVLLAHGPKEAMEEYEAALRRRTDKWDVSRQLTLTDDYEIFACPSFCENGDRDAVKDGLFTALDDVSYPVQIETSRFYNRKEGVETFLDHKPYEEDRRAKAIARFNVTQNLATCASMVKAGYGI